MSKERYNEIFAECFENLETFEKVAIHNNYVTEGNGYGNEICDNTEDFIDAVFPSAYDALNSIGRYNINDDWAWVDDLGNLYSADSESEMELSDVDEMAEYYYDNMSYLKDIKGMDEWYDAVYFGLDEEEEDEDDEEEDEDEEDEEEDDEKYIDWFNSLKERIGE